MGNVAIELYKHTQLEPAEINSLLKKAQQKWSLTIDQSLKGGSRSTVYRCNLGKQEIVLKLTPTSLEAELEMAALIAWQDTDASVKLIDADALNNTLLLEPLIKATNKQLQDDDSSTKLATSLKRLHSVSKFEVSRFYKLEAVYPHLEQRARDDLMYERQNRNEPLRAQTALNLLDSARSLVSNLCASNTKQVLLHGDLSVSNILLNNDHYVFIDPMPCIGDPCSDIGFFAADQTPVGNILKRAARIAELMGENALRAEKWATIWAIVQSVQAWRKDQAALEQFISSKDAVTLLQP